MRQEDEAGGPQDTGKAQEPEGSAEKAGSKKDKYQKAQAKAEHAGGKLGKAREKLDKTEALPILCITMSVNQRLTW